MTLDLEQAQALSQDLGDRAQAYADQYLSGPTQVASDALRQLGQQTKHSATLDQAADQLEQNLQLLPTTVAAAAYHTSEVEQIVPDWITDHLNGIQQVMQLYRTGGADWADVDSDARATAKIVSDAVTHLQQRLDPQQVENQIVMPSVQRFGS